MVARIGHILTAHLMRQWILGRNNDSVEQSAFAMRRAESGTSVTVTVRELGVSEQMFYRRKNRFDDLLRGASNS